MTHDLISEMISELDATCTPRGGHGAAGQHLLRLDHAAVNGQEVEIDSRPSDALAVAVRTSAPIFAAEDVIQESAIEFEHEVEDTEEVVDKFKKFLDEVTPEDFAARALGKRVPADLGPATSGRRRGACRCTAPAPPAAPPARSKQTPAASAAWGSRLVSVRPGIACASRTYRSLCSSRIMSTRAKP